MRKREREEEISNDKIKKDKENLFLSALLIGFVMPRKYWYKVCNLKKTWARD